MLLYLVYVQSLNIENFKPENTNLLQKRNPKISSVRRIYFDYRTVPVLFLLFIFANIQHLFFHLTLVIRVQLSCLHLIYSNNVVGIKNIGLAPQKSAAEFILCLMHLGWVADFLCWCFRIPCYFSSGLPPSYSIA